MGNQRVLRDHVGKMGSKYGTQPITEQYIKHVGGNGVKTSGFHLPGGQELPVLMYFQVNWKRQLVPPAN